MSFVDNRDFWTEFMLLYQSLRPLWDSTSNGYRNKRIKYDCYLQLVAKAKEIYPNAGVEFVKRKIENLRASFRREHRKVERSKMEGENEVYHPQLWYYELMLFTSDPRYCENIVVPVKRSTEDSDEDDAEPYEDCKDLYESELMTDSVDSSLPWAADEASTVQSTSPAVFASHKPFKKLCSDFQRRNPFFNSPSTNMPIFKEAFVFGQSVGLQLNEVEQKQKTIAEKVISEVLFHAKLGNLTESSTVLLTQNNNHCSTPTTSTQPS